MSLIAAAPVKVERGGSVAGLARALSSAWLGLAFAAIAVLSQSFGHHNGDNSWLFTVAEKVIDGARPYIDVIESNPPAAFLFYAPAVYAARFAHVSVELAASTYVFLCCGLAIWLAGQILRDTGVMSSAEAGFARNVAIFALVLLPGYSFAEREHIACILILPILAVYTARAAGSPVSVWQAVVAGLAASLAMAIKPHFAMAVAAPLAFVLAHRRSPRSLFAIEQLVAGAGVIANVALVLRLFPAYLELATISFDVYVPLREPLSYLMREPWLLTNVALLAGLAVTFGRECATPRVAIPALASLGFLGTFFLQGKGWVNHGLPGVELAFVAIGMAFAPTFATNGGASLEAAWARVRRSVLFLFFPAALGAPVLFGLLLPASGFEEYRGLTAAVLRHAPPRPKIIALSPRLDVGHPLTRRVGGEWVGRPNALWLMIFSRMFIDANRGDEAYRARLRQYIDRDARGFREDMAASHPDIVLVVDDPRVEKAMAHPDVAAAMAGYGPIETVDGVAVWTRRP